MLDRTEKIMKEQELKSIEIIEQGSKVSKYNVKDLQTELDRLNYSWQKGRIKDAAKYDKDYDELVAKIEAAQEKHIEIVKQDFSKAEAALSGDWKTLYNALDDAHKRAFWRSFIESIEVDWEGEEKKISRVNFF